MKAVALLCFMLAVLAVTSANPTKSAVAVAADTPCAVDVKPGSGGNSGGGITKPQSIEFLGTSMPTTAYSCKKTCKTEHNAEWYPTHAYTIQQSKTLTLRNALFNTHGKFKNYFNYWMNTQKSGKGMKMGQEVFTSNSKDFGWNWGNFRVDDDKKSQGVFYNASQSDRNKIGMEEPSKNKRCVCEKIVE